MIGEQVDDDVDDEEQAAAATLRCVRLFARVAKIVGERVLSRHSSSLGHAPR